MSGGEGRGVNGICTVMYFQQLGNMTEKTLGCPVNTVDQNNILCIETQESLGQYGLQSQNTMLMSESLKMIE